MITYCPRCGTRYVAGAGTDFIERTLRCAECAVTVTDPPAMLSPTGKDEDEVQYDLAEWETSERTAATTALLEAEIPYRWEEDLVLTVPAVTEDEVDLLLDELGEAEELEDDGVDGGEEAQAAMSDLFVAADRLQHDPADVSLSADVLTAATTVGACAPPYGIERPVWRRIQALAATLAADLEEALDEETVAADARAVREYLRDLV